jgi:hypothetical protein
MEAISVSSPRSERKKIENEQLREEWSGCCSKSNKEFVKYITQIGFGASVMIFSMVQISRADVESKEIYFSLLSGTLGLFLPHPQMKSEK